MRLDNSLLSRKENMTGRPLEKALKAVSEGKVDDASEIEYYFNYSATLRIFGDIPDLTTLSRNLGIEPTYSHHKGDKKTPTSKPYEHDMWMYKVPLSNTEPLQAHIDSLWSLLKPKKEQLLDLKKRLNVDVFLGYRSNCDHAGIEVPHTSLEMFQELEIPFGVLLVVT